MKINLFVRESDLDYLNKILTRNITEPEEFSITIGRQYFEGSYLVTLEYSQFISLQDRNIFNNLISL
jgi:hypothetical protein